MGITLVQLLEIERHRKAAKEAMDELQQLLRMTAITLSKQGESAQAKALLDFDRRLDDGFFFPRWEAAQSEWMGGPTSGPGSENTKTYLRRDPIFGGRHWSDKEVQAAKDAGLLTGGPDLTGPKEKE